MGMLLKSGFRLLLSCVPDKFLPGFLASRLNSVWFDIRASPRISRAKCGQSTYVYAASSFRGTFAPTASPARTYISWRIAQRS